MTQADQLLLFATVVPDGAGGYRIHPGKPRREMTTREAAKVLGVARSTMWELRNHPEAGKILKWRFTTPARRRVLFETDSVFAYLRFTQTIEDR